MPNQVQQVGFSSPGFDYSADLSQIERRKKLAEALQAQSMEPLQTQMAGGWAVPISPFQGLAKLAQAYSGNKLATGAEEQQRALAQKSQTEYRAMLADALSKMKTDPQAAMGILATHPMGKDLMPLAMQNYQQMALVEALKKNNMQGALSSGGGPTVANEAKMQQSNAPGGFPLEAYIAAGQVPGALPYIQGQEKKSEALGGVQYDQQGNAFVTTKGGGVTYLPGIKARDKMEMVDTGGSMIPINPYNINTPIPKGLSPADQLKIPLEQQKSAIEAGRYQFETGQSFPSGRGPMPNQPPMQPPVQSQMQPQVQQPQGAQISAAQHIPIPQAGPAPPPTRQAYSQPLPGPAGANAQNMTPKQRTELAAKRAEEQPAAAMALKQTQEQHKVVMDKIAEAKRLIGWTTTGFIGSNTSGIPGTSAYDLERTIATIKSAVAIDKMMQMKKASATGATGFGQLNQKELDLLLTSVSALDIGQTKEQLIHHLNDIEKHMNTVLDQMQRSYSDVYGQGQIQTSPQEVNEPGNQGWSIRRRQ